jgi:hypothetical protein
MTEEAPQPQLTERQQFWLDHIARCDAAGHLTKAYAAAHGLSVQAMYSARRDLVDRGALAPGGRGICTSPKPRFTRVARSQDSAQAAHGLAVQIQLPNGAVVGFPAPLDADALRLVIQTAAALP